MGDNSLTKKLPFLLLAISLLSSFFIVVNSSFPFTGVSISLAVLSSLVFFLKKDKTSFDTVTYLATLFFSFCIIWRANGFLTFLNVLTTFYLGSILSLSKEERENLSLVQLAIAPFLVIFESLKTKNIFPLSKDVFTEGEMSKGKKGSVLSILLTVAVLLVIVPLLASANPFFNKLVTNILSVFRLDVIFKEIFSGLFIPRAIFFVVLMFMIPKLLSFVRSKCSLLKAPFLLESVPFLLPKTAVAIVLAIFFVTQAQLYFSDLETLKALDYTYSQYASEVFAQLTVVSGIIIGLLYNDKSKAKWNKWLTYILLIEGAFLTFMALKSVNDYSNQWGFTQKRLWGYTGVFWMLAVFAVYTYGYLKNSIDKLFVKSVFAITAATLVFVNLANFDFLIFNYRKSVTERGVDHGYLAYLSSDAHSYREEIEEINKTIPSQITNQEEYYHYGIPAWTVARNIERLQEKYKKFDFRTFNFSEYQEYLDVKDINTQNYRRDWNNTSLGKQLY